MKSCQNCDKKFMKFLTKPQKNDVTKMGKKNFEWSKTWINKGKKFQKRSIKFYIKILKILSNVIKNNQNKFRNSYFLKFRIEIVFYRRWYCNRQMCSFFWSSQKIAKFWYRKKNKKLIINNYPYTTGVRGNYIVLFVLFNFGFILVSFRMRHNEHNTTIRDINIGSLTHALTADSKITHKLN